MSEKNEERHNETKPNTIRKMKYEKQQERRQNKQIENRTNERMIRVLGWQKLTIVRHPSM
jgi:hypothetical protein